MKQSTIDYFIGKRWAYDYMLSQDCIPSREKGMPGEIYNLIREEFDPGYENDTQCPPCAFAIVKDGFRMFNERMDREPIRIAANFPAQQPPAMIANQIIYNQEELTPKKMIPSGKETEEERKARLSDPNRVIKRRAKRK